ncbi:hypothetical protein BH23GEM9_BH23GEM9_12900 [soil metagenome]
MDIRERYRPRQIRLIELWGVADWRLKLYGIAYGRDRPAAALLEAARIRAAGVLPRPAVTATRYGVGFMGVHQGRDADVAFVNWWSHENELHHHVWVAHGGTGNFMRAGDSRFIACVWDLAVLAFERQAWIDSILAAPRPDLDRYLALQLEALV